MICVTIQNKDYKGISEVLASPYIEMAEIRLDSCSLSPEEIDYIFQYYDIPLIATCRISSLVEKLKAEKADKNEEKLYREACRIAEARLTKAIQAGAAYVDLEIEAPAMMSKRIRRQARECGTYIIRSYHDFEGTDSSEALKALVEKCMKLGADIAKIVTTAHNEKDNARTLSLYGSFPADTLVAFCMGEGGKNSRIECLRKGAPYSYAALSEEEKAAPGQWSLEEMRKAVYGDRKPIGSAFGDNSEAIRMPSSKSFAQRAIIAAALANGVSVLKGYSRCGDNESAIAVAKALGANVSEKAISPDGSNSVLTIRGTGSKKGSFKKNSLHTGESGFLTRLMLPLLGFISEGPVHITGEKTLVNRPLKGAEEIMGAFGISIECEKKDGEVHVPLTIKGSLTPAEAVISGKDGSQLISGLLSALPLAKKDSVLRLVEPKSIPYIFITLDILKQYGIRVENEMEGGKDFLETQDWAFCDAINFYIKGGQRFRPATIHIEADWSSAANFLVAGAIFGKVALKGLESVSLQADISIMDILSEAGASLSFEDDTRIIRAHKSPLRAFSIDAGNCPDLFPIISILAAFSQGVSKISGVRRLATKESDRGVAIENMLTQMGVYAEIAGDYMIIQGESLCSRILSGRLLKGGKYTSNHDHRMVMALMVAGLGADSPIEIDDIECVGKSFPTFIELFKKL